MTIEKLLLFKEKYKLVNQKSANKVKNKIKNKIKNNYDVKINQ